MSVSKNTSKLSIDDINRLKDRLNIELKRRSGEGSVYGYQISDQE